MASQSISVTDMTALLDDIADLPHGQQMAYLEAMTRSNSVRYQRVARALLLNELDALAADHPRHAKGRHE